MRAGQYENLLITKVIHSFLTVSDISSTDEKRGRMPLMRQPSTPVVGQHIQSIEEVDSLPDSTAAPSRQSFESIEGRTLYQI